MPEIVMKAEPDLESFVESLNTGEPVPTVEARDIRAALLFFVEARATMDRYYENTQAPNPQQLSFGLEDLATRCSPEAKGEVKLFAVAIRAMLLEEILKLSADREERETITEGIAKLPLLAAELRNPEAVLLRLRKASGQR
jgi:hypothetical protein